MADIPCLDFSPMLVGGQLFCEHCGFYSDFHLDIVDISDDEHNQQHQPQQLTAAATDNESNAINWEMIQMDEQWPVQPPPPPQHGNNAEGIPQPGRTRSFNEWQVECMLDMARRLQWTLRGRSRDASIDDFCTEIGVVRSQFANWLNRNRERYGGRRG
uniref:Uncharacterized protein n=1 Tax=Kalanchoe fedtschenkoi TaxID=63787 RepID=A0A7N0TGN4_KALFE